MSGAGEEMSSGVPIPGVGERRGWRILFVVMASASWAFFLIVLGWIAADPPGGTDKVRLVWDMSWLAATVVVVLAILWRLTMPLPEEEDKNGKLEKRLDQILEQIELLVQSKTKGITGAAPQPVQQEKAAAPVLATLILSQDHTTWLAFTLGMTSEVLLVTAFIQASSSGFKWVLALGGVLVAGVFWNMVLRSNADMSALYHRAESIWKHIFHIPRQRRRGISADLVMNLAFGGWIIAWLVALAFVLKPAI